MGVVQKGANIQIRGMTRSQYLVTLRWLRSASMKKMNKLSTVPHAFMDYKFSLLMLLSDGKR